MSLIQNLYRDYGDFKVDIPRWELADSGVTALWGRSGAGKTSVFNLLIGLEPCPGLSWQFQGEELAKQSLQEKRLGVVFQEYDIFPHMTALENLQFALKARGMSINEYTSDVEQLVETLQLSNCLNTLGSKLSGGEKQRTALARALVGKPRFLFLDEPFSNLDSDLRKSARLLVKNAITAQKVPTLLITHDQDDIDALANHVVKIENGQLCLSQ